MSDIILITNFHQLTACKQIEVLVVAKVLNAVSARCNVRGNSPRHSNTALTKNGTSSQPRKSTKNHNVEINNDDNYYYYKL